MLLSHYGFFRGPGMFLHCRKEGHILLTQSSRQSLFFYFKRLKLKYWGVKCDSLTSIMEINKEAATHTCLLCPPLIEGETMEGQWDCDWLIIKAINSLCQNCIFKVALKFLSLFCFLVLKTVSEPNLPNSWEQERHRKKSFPLNQFKIT